MALYRPSIMVPDLKEIDITQNNTFTCQVNSSGSTVKAYKFQMWSGDGNDLLYDGDSQQLGVNHFVKNKGTLEIPVTPNMLGSSNKVRNGRDFQWGVRVYEKVLGSTTQPQTYVCSGFLVGTTRYVIWTQSSPTLLEEGKYVEIEVSSQSGIIPPTAPNQDNITYPTSYPYRERHKIEFVSKELGWAKNITKLELDDSFKYNYPDGTSFKIFNCSDQHTLTSVYVDPNDIIERGRYIKISDTSVNGSSSKWRKIIGYGEDSGEVRVQEPFNNVPKNGMTFTIGKMNTDNNTIEDVANSGTNVVGGVAVTGTFVTMSNSWGQGHNRLFIQPNINIKSDGTNPDELIFDIDGNITRIDIKQSLNTTGNLIPGKKVVDTTFNKLDNTQWLLETGNLVLVNGSVPISPQTPYQVFTDFQDSSPLAYFYARKTPDLRIQFRNYNDPSDDPEYAPVNIPEDIDSYLPGVPWRDIYFVTTYYSADNVEIKYYQYKLYVDDETEPIAESEEKYDTDLDWWFRGFQTPDNPLDPGKIYRIEIKIVDEYNKEFIESNQFRVCYKVEESFVPIGVTLNCDERCMDIKVTTPAFVKTTDFENKKTVTIEDIDTQEKFLRIPEDKILNYTNLKDLQSSPYTIPNDFTLYTQFQITGDFADQVQNGEELMVLEFSYENQEGNDDIVRLTFGGLTSFYMEDGSVVTNEKRFKLMLYINNEPANLFKNSDGIMVNYIDLSENSSFMTATSIKNAVQKVQNFVVVNSFPTIPVEGTVYVLNNSLYYNGTFYGMGPYTWDHLLGWQIQSEFEYFFLENIKQAPGSTFDSLGVPINCQSTFGNINFQEVNNIWIDTENVNARNKELLNRYWYEFYFVSKGNNKTCEIRVNTQRK